MRAAEVPCLEESSCPPDGGGCSSGGGEVVGIMVGDEGDPEGDGYVGMVEEEEEEEQVEAGLGDECELGACDQSEEEDSGAGGEDSLERAEGAEARAVGSWCDALLGSPPWRGLPWELLSGEDSGDGSGDSSEEVSPHRD